MTDDRCIWAKRALTPAGWEESVRVHVAADGTIAEVQSGADAVGHRVDTLVPAMPNLHSHAFQRVMAGLTEWRSSDRGDSFWTWRELMYRFVGVLTPDEVETIAAFVQMEMLEAGFASVAEFHYLHHDTDGGAYADPAEMSARIAAAAAKTGIGLTLLPVHYERGGCDDRPLAAHQRRFGNDVEAFARLLDAAAGHVDHLPSDARLGVAPHSLRAVSPDSLAAVAGLRPAMPVHLHIAEQPAEVAEVQAAYGKAPVAFLFDRMDPDDRWCLVHATHMTDHETRLLARSGGVAGLCPITEANLGDGLFPMGPFREADGVFGIGSDSNILVSATEELRLLEYGQRLIAGQRNAIAGGGRSTGRTLWEEAVKGGHRALGRPGGVIAAGSLADLTAFDTASVPTALTGAADPLDPLIFALPKAPVTDVWSAGRHVVTEGRHISGEAIRSAYATTVRRLMERL